MKARANINDVSALQPDYMGFIFYDKSKRHVENDFVIPEIPNSIIKVGVFVNATSEEILKLTKRHAIDYLQLHGEETIRQCEELKELGFIVIKTFPISENFNFNILTPYKKVCDFFLFDTKGESYGGNGKKFDWSLLQNYNHEIPFFLSGGLSMTNAKEAMNLHTMNIHALDVNSGFEIEPGLKNIASLKQLFELRNQLSI